MRMKVERAVRRKRLKHHFVKASRHQTRRAAIAQDHTPFAIDDERRIGFMMAGDAAERVADAAISRMSSDRSG
jgi:hypothetical protein